MTITPEIIGLIIAVGGLIFSAGAFVAVTRYSTGEVKKQFEKFADRFLPEFQEIKTTVAVHTVQIDQLKNPERPSNGV